MKITHICLCGPTTDNWNYQENLLSKYHTILGNNVTIITSEFVLNKKGNLETFKKTNYFNEDGVKMIRLEMKGVQNFNKKIKIFKGVFKSINKSKPDIIFVHGCQFLDIKQVVKYVKLNPNVKIFVDNHADFSNSAKNFLSKNILHKIIWRRCARLIEPYTTKFYGVLPARVDFLKDMYNIPEEKVDLLVMGADDEKVEEAKSIGIRDKTRKKYDINRDDFLIITGGKIDKNKSQILLLMEAVNNIKNKNVKLLIIGSVIDEYKDEFNSLLGENISYIGWVESSDIYKYFESSDLVVFPGLHSVLWEQAVGQGIPCVFKYIEGFTHVDLGGNCKFVYNDSPTELKAIINNIINDKELYKYMKNIAMSKGMNAFSYKKIAKKSIEDTGGRYEFI